MLLELHRRGHEVHVRTRESEVERFAALGLRAGPVDAGIDEIEFDDWKARSAIGALKRCQETFVARGALEIPDMRKAVAAVEPDALIVDVACEGAGCVAEASRLPFSYFSPFPPIFASKDAPPYGPGYAPARGAPGRARDRLATMLAGPVVKRLTAPLNAMRATVDLPAVTDLADHYLAAHRFLIFTAEPYEYPRRDWPPAVRLVGPGLWEPPADAPPWLSEETRPTVLVTTSTVRQGDDTLLTTALEAFANEDVFVVATAGAQDASRFSVPANARVEQFLPHAPVVARAACVISHGGMGITQKALAAGVPVCVVPFCRDQFEVARRVEAAHAGTRLHHKRLRPERLRSAVKSAMTMHAGAAQVAEAFARAGGPGGVGAAADAFEELLQPAGMPN
jgi:MGT family glycosyltransferase